jgi:cytoskeletal protein RodZ
MDDDQPLEFGAELARAREQRGITLGDIARRTKIGVEALKAIERGDMAALPGGLYTRGFLRAFAREVGCNPDEIVRRYREKFKDHDVAADAVAQLEVGVSVSCAPGQVHVKDIDAMTLRRSRTGWIIGGAVLLLGVAAHFVVTPTASWKSRREPRAQSALKQEPSSTAAAAAAAVPRSTAGAATPTATPPIGTSGSSPSALPSHPTDTSSNVLRLDVKPNGACWLSATADGERVLYRLMGAGDHTQIEAHEDVILHVGDPATCAFDINGTGVRQLGVAGQPVTVHLTRENFEQFLDRPGSDRQD